MSTQGKADFLDKSSYLDRDQALRHSAKPASATTEASGSQPGVEAPESQHEHSKPAEIPKQDIHESYRDGIVALWRHLKGVEGISEIGYGLKNNDLNTDQLTLYVVCLEGLESTMGKAFRFQNSKQQSMTLPLELRVEGKHSFTNVIVNAAISTISEPVNLPDLPVHNEENIRSLTRNNDLPILGGRHIKAFAGYQIDQNQNISGGLRGGAGTMGGWVRKRNQENDQVRFLGITNAHVVGITSSMDQLSPNILLSPGQQESLNLVTDPFFRVLEFRYINSNRIFNLEPAGSTARYTARTMDAAILTPNMDTMIPSGIGTTGYRMAWDHPIHVLGSGVPEVGRIAIKIGRTTGLTWGKIVSYSMPNKDVQEERDFVYNFRVENNSQTIAEGGDSGSLFLVSNDERGRENTWKVIGMLFESLTYGDGPSSTTQQTGNSPNRYGAKGILANVIEQIFDVEFP